MKIKKRREVLKEKIMIEKRSIRLIVEVEQTNILEIAEKMI